ncbi:MAG: PP2C family serine/threonine-protein phosphatase [Saprospiraceae bacterium]
MKIRNFTYQGQRDYQEDNLYIDQKAKSLFFVCDGVGGSHGGSTASNIIVNEIKKQYNGLCQNKIDKGKIIEMIKIAHNALVDQSKHNLALKDMATTIALLYICGNKAITCHVGDSKVYYLNVKTGNWWCTKDDSTVQELFDSGVLNSEEEMKNHPYKNRITRALSGNNLEPPIITIETIDEIETDDIFLVCTDGALEDYSSHQLVEHFLSKEKSFDQAWDEFEENCKNHSSDNNTSIGIHI